MWAMKTTRTTACVTLVALTLAWAGALFADEGAKQFAGTWKGKTPNGTLQLVVTSEGKYTYSYSGINGDASGTFKAVDFTKEGKDYFVSIPAVHKKPLKLQLTDKEKSLKLTSEDKFEAVLSKVEK